jgi:Lhr-like helicase
MSIKVGGTRQQPAQVRHISKCQNPHCGNTQLTRLVDYAGCNVCGWSTRMNAQDVLDKWGPVKTAEQKTIEAIAFVVSRGYSQEAAESIVAKHGADKILHDKNNPETDEEALARIKGQAVETAVSASGEDAHPSAPRELDYGASLDAVAAEQKAADDTNHVPPVERDADNVITDPLVESADPRPPEQQKAAKWGKKRGQA